MSDDQNFQAIFDALPGNSILLKTDEPTYTVLAASPSCLAQAGHTKESMIGKGVFEAFSANNADSTDTGNRDLKDSYQQVIAEKQTHVLPAHG